MDMTDENKRKLEEIRTILEREDTVKAVDVAGDIVPLLEKAVAADNTVPVKLIQPGWGQSGYYSESLLKDQGSKAFPAGTQMFWDHPTATEEAERPERSLRDLAAELVTDAAYQDGPAGPGLYAKAKVFDGYRDAVESLAPHIGLSIRADGRAKVGEADGQKGPIITEITRGRSVDFVTQAGAGGQILELFESARSRAVHQAPTSHGGDGNMEELREAQRARDEAQAEATQLKEALAAKDTQLNEAQAELNRLREGEILREAKALVAETLPAELPEITRKRLTEALGTNPVVVDGALDRDATKAAIEEAVKAEIAYLAEVTGSGRVHGMSPTQEQQTDHTAELEAQFLALGLSESAAKCAAQGR